MKSGKQTMLTAAKAEADLAESKYLEIKQKINAEAVTLYQYVNSTLANWHNLQLLKSNAKELSAISLKSYQLGESSWYNWLNSQQQFNESKNSATNSQLEALENYYLLAIDAHYLWADLVEVKN